MLYQAELRSHPTSRHKLAESLWIASVVLTKSKGAGQGSLRADFDRGSKVRHFGEVRLKIGTETPTFFADMLLCE